MALSKQRKLEEALRAGVSGRKIDIDKLMASTTTTLLNCNIVFTPSSVPFCNPSEIENTRITVLEPSHEATTGIGRRQRPNKSYGGIDEKVHKRKVKRAKSTGDKPEDKKTRRPRRRGHKKVIVEKL